MAALKMLFVLDPISKLVIDKDTTFAFMLAAQARGHEVLACRVEDLHARGDQPLASVRRVALEAVVGAHHRWLGPAEVVDLRGLDVVMMRKDPPFDMNYIFATYILDLAVGHARVINRPQGLRDCNEKTYILRFPELIPPTVVARDRAVLRAFVAEQGEVVLKPLDGKGGEGILLTRHQDLNLNSMIELLTHNGARFIMGQRFIPESRAGDKRVLMIDGEPVGAFLRVPADDDLRGNMSAGATVTSATLSPHDLAICQALAPRLKADGHLFVGIDLLGDYLTEINVTSPTGVHEVRKHGGADVADQLIAWLEYNA